MLQHALFPTFNRISLFVWELAGWSLALVDKVSWRDIESRNERYTFLPIRVLHIGFPTFNWIYLFVWEFEVAREGLWLKRYRTSQRTIHFSSNTAFPWLRSEHTDCVCDTASSRDLTDFLCFDGKLRRKVFSWNDIEIRNERYTFLPIPLSQSSRYRDSKSQWTYRLRVWYIWFQRFYWLSLFWWEAALEGLWLSLIK